MKNEEKVFDSKKELIDFLTGLAINGQYVFRGYNYQKQMLPSIIRNKAEDIEKDLLTDFERYGSQYINISNPLDLMSYAQHFGLSTRLLDFTVNPFIALYFALFRDKGPNYTEPEDKIYYYLRYADINENDYRHQIFIKGSWEKLGELFNNSWVNRAIQCIEQVENEFSDDGKQRQILFIDPNQSNQRLVMQQGLFMFPYVLDEDKHKQIIEDNTSVIKIHKDLRLELQDYLGTIGINAFRLMPDLSSVCEAVERNIRENRNKNSELFKKKSMVYNVADNTNE